MSAVARSISASEVAKGLSIFEIDESLAALVEAAEADAEANNGQPSEPIKEALVTYAEAFGYKVGSFCGPSCAVERCLSPKHLEISC
jgi:hypothetical protein